jgi:hypothetical protein
MREIRTSGSTRGEWDVPLRITHSPTLLFHLFVFAVEVYPEAEHYLSNGRFHGL